MPSSLKLFDSGVCMAGPLDADKDLAAALGRMTGTWSHLQFMLGLIFQKATGLSPKMSDAIFDQFQNTQAQQRLMERVAPHSSFLADGDRKLLTAALKSYVALAKRRNDLAHNPFGWSDPTTQSGLYLLQKTKGRPEFDATMTTRLISVEEIESLTEEINFCRLQMLAIVSPGHSSLPPELQ
jgi:hypothetical protein